MSKPVFFSNITIIIGKCGLHDYPPEYKGVKNKVAEDYQLYYIREGTGKIYYEGEAYNAGQGDLFIFHPGISVDICPDGRHDFKVAAFHFEARVLFNMNIFTIYPLPYKINVWDYPGFDDELTELIKISVEKNGFYTIKVLPVISKIILYIIGKGENMHLYNELVANDHKFKIRKVLNYIEANYDRNITINELAKIACFSPNYFVNYFKKKTGVSPQLFIRNYKIEKSKQLIDEDISFNEIASRLGFNDQFHFSRTFKNITGVSPKEYRDDLLDKLL